MCEKIRCELFHAFEGHCCPQGVPCPFVKKPATAEEVVKIHASAQLGMIAGLAALTLFSAVFVGLLATDYHLERVARANQERIVWK